MFYKQLSYLTLSSKLCPYPMIASTLRCVACSNPMNISQSWDRHPQPINFVFSNLSKMWFIYFAAYFAAVFHGAAIYLIL